MGVSTTWFGFAPTFQELERDFIHIYYYTVRMTIPNQIVVIVDSREQTPLKFPKTITLLDPECDPQYARHITRPIFTITRRLETGDYAIQGFEEGCLAERKANIREVASNCLTADRPRFIATLSRLRAACQRPLLIFEGSNESLLKATPYVKSPGLAVDALLQLLSHFNITYTCYKSTSHESRRAAAEFMIRYMIASTFQLTEHSNGNHSQRLDPSTIS